MTVPQPQIVAYLRRDANEVQVTLSTHRWTKEVLILTGTDVAFITATEPVAGVELEVLANFVASALAVVSPHGRFFRVCQSLNFAPVVSEVVFVIKNPHFRIPEIGRSPSLDPEIREQLYTALWRWLDQTGGQQ